MQRRHFELLAAALARHFIVEPQQVIAQLVELGAIFTALGLPVLALGSSHPANGILVGTLAPWACILCGAGFRLLLEDCFLIKGHEWILLSFRRAFRRAFRRTFRRTFRRAFRRT